MDCTLVITENMYESADKIWDLINENQNAWKYYCDLRKNLEETLDGSGSEYLEEIKDMAYLCRSNADTLHKVYHLLCCEDFR